MALGNGTDTPGVNHKLLPFLQERKGKRFGIISTFSVVSPKGHWSDRHARLQVLDFFDVVPGLVEAVIGI